MIKEAPLKRESALIDEEQLGLTDNVLSIGKRDRSEFHNVKADKKVLIAIALKWSALREKESATVSVYGAGGDGPPAGPRAAARAPAHAERD